MFINHFLYKTAMFAKPLPERPYGASYIEKATWARESIYHVLTRAIEEIIYHVFLPFGIEIFLAMIDVFARQT